LVRCPAHFLSVVRLIKNLNRVEGDELMLTLIEDLGFSHEVEEGDDEWDGLEKVYAKFTVQCYVDPIRRQFCRPATK
tara:strand:+ start:158 stop:388 length:231 start_codon:yes stop_codon:yes gene_type:complete